MSAAGGMATSGNPSRLQQLSANVSATFATLLRKPRGGARPSWVTGSHFIVGTFVTAITIALSMMFLDSWLSHAARRLSPTVVAVFDEITDFGKSGWFLVPSGLLLIAIALFATCNMPRVTRQVLSAVTVRVGFIFLAIGLPGLCVTILKRLIGRARPFVGGEDTISVYMPFGWDVDYASFPSGHATTAFGVLAAFGAIWPWARPFLWIYALLIAASRVVLTAHYPSDVVAGAAFGMLGAILVRDWFAVRGLGFFVDPQGRVQAMPGPSFRRMMAVARRLRSA
jgi:membrane-associated phospholipid phosphatase